MDKLRDRTAVSWMQSDALLIHNRKLGSTYCSTRGAMRSSVNRVGYTPNKLMLGRETNQPADLMFGSQSERKCLILSLQDHAPAWVVRRRGSGDGDSQPGVGIQPFDLSLLDTATQQEKEVSVSGGQEVPVRVQGTPEETQDEVPRELVVEAVEQSAPVAAKVSVSGEQEVPVLGDSLQTLAISEETLNTPEETEEPEVQGEVPTTHSGEQSASVPASTDPMAFKREYRTHGGAGRHKFGQAQ
ncbi:Hypothetical predicted protein [Mytilus galloprovincialis]|uniref:Uncharacterized protein n=1 Tax=Mytilus galloprovincialis TaxID=29158 RepID=A0A8B6GCF8_MYTGA|nr:Hypothetical predicted protein [Mytilus galloprovincialis]